MPRFSYQDVDNPVFGVALDDIGGNSYALRVSGRRGSCAIFMTGDQVDRLLQHLKRRLVLVKTDGLELDENGYMGVSLDDIGGGKLAILMKSSLGRRGYVELTRSQVGAIIGHVERRNRLLRNSLTAQQKQERTRSSMSMFDQYKM